MSQPLSIRMLFVALLCFYLLALVTGILILGPTMLFDGRTALLSLALGTLLLGSLAIARGTLFAQVAMLAFFFSIFVFPRIIEYLFLPELVRFPFGEGTDSTAINRGLAYVLLGTGGIVAGFFSAERVVRRSRVFLKESGEGPIDEFPVGAILPVFVLVLAIDFYIRVWLGIGIFGKLQAETGNTLVQLVLGLFGIDMVFFGAFMALAVGKNANRIRWMVVLVAIYIFFLSLGGSRGGGLRVLSMSLAILVASRGNFRSRWYHYLVVLVSIGLMSLALFPVATQIRTDLQLRNLRVAQEGNGAKVGWLFEGVRWGEQQGDGVTLYRKPVMLLAAVANRLAVVDYSVLMLTEDGNPETRAKFMNLMYAVKSIANFFVPGSAYPEAELSTSRAVAVIYRNISGVGHLSGYFSEYWTAWGLSYVLFGWWGGLVALFVAGFAFHALYLLALRLLGRFRYYFTSWFLFVVPTLFYISMGVDHSVTTGAVLLLQGVVVMLGFSLVKTALRLAEKPARATA